MNGKTVYLVICDGYSLEEYGARIELVGIFETEQEAQNAIDAQPLKEIRQFCQIFPVVVGDIQIMHHLSSYPYSKVYGGDIYLGGYYE